MTNQYFNFYKQNQEQDLLADLNAEAISIYGMDVYYVQRTHTALDSILGEDTQSEFTRVYPIEMYLKTTEGFGGGIGGQDFVSSVGLEIRDSAKFTISRKTFKEKTNGSGLPRPVEGDLIYFPMVACIFEIRYVEDEKPFYELGSLYLWDISVELFEYSGEKFRTGIPEIDSIENRYTASADIVVESGSGSFQAKERLYQGDALEVANFKAEVISWEPLTNTIKVKYSNGEIKLDLPIKGITSGTSRVVSSSTLLESKSSTNDPYQDNEELQTEGETIVDFDPLNPFGGE